MWVGWRFRRQQGKVLGSRAVGWRVGREDEVKERLSNVVIGRRVAST